LPAAVALPPATALIETTAAGEYVKVHCTAAGSLPAGEVRVKFNVAPPPDTVPDESASVSCASRGETDKSNNVTLEIPQTKQLRARLPT
jgi:hypothetical protein